MAFLWRRDYARRRYTPARLPPSDLTLAAIVGSSVRPRGSCHFLVDSALHDSFPQFPQFSPRFCPSDFVNAALPSQLSVSPFSQYTHILLHKGASSIHQHCAIFVLAIARRLSKRSTHLSRRLFGVSCPSAHARYQAGLAISWHRRRPNARIHQPNDPIVITPSPTGGSLLETKQIKGRSGLHLTTYAFRHCLSCLSQPLDHTRLSLRAGRGSRCQPRPGPGIALINQSVHLRT